MSHYFLLAPLSVLQVRRKCKGCIKQVGKLLMETGTDIPLCPLYESSVTCAHRESFVLSMMHQSIRRRSRGTDRNGWSFSSMASRLLEKEACMERRVSVFVAFHGLLIRYVANRGIDFWRRGFSFVYMLDLMYRAYCPSPASIFNAIAWPRSRLFVLGTAL